jgi:hypothetical protein
MAFKLREFFTAAAQGHTSLVDPVHGLQMEEGDGVDIPDPLTTQIRCSSLAHIKRLGSIS